MCQLKMKKDFPWYFLALGLKWPFYCLLVSRLHQYAI